jgi:crossover junction endodeoxyribonuclease RusA
MTESSKKVKPWRQDVREAAKAALDLVDEWPPGGDRTGYRVWFEFVLYRPAVVPKAHPGWTNKSLDWDKAARSTGDALVEAGVLSDDRRVFEGHVSKRLAAPGEPTGCFIRVEQVTW